jgi:hypothetical protein
MWLYIFAFALLIFGIVGGVLSGGSLTVVLVPIGLIALVTAVVTSLMAQRAGGGLARPGSGSGPGDGGPRPLPHSDPAPSAAAAPSTPDDLSDARRQQQ